MRKAFAETLLKVAAENPYVIFLTGDLGFGYFDKFQEKFPDRYLNVGVAEAQLIATAAGLAIEGYRPVTYSIASFITARPYEQIRHCLSYPNLPVIIVGAGRGFTYGKSGVTHHAIEDIALMSALPAMTVVLPGDPIEVKQLFPQLLDLNGPSYFSVGRYGEPEYDAEESAVLGKARLLRNGEKIAIFSTGEIAYEVYKALKKLENENIYPIAYQIHSVKPIDRATLDKVSKNIKYFIIVEEHVPVGGLYSAIEKWNNSNRNGVKLIRLGMPDKFAIGNLSKNETYEKFKFSANAIESVCRRLWNYC